MNRQAIKILSLALVLATSSSVAFAQKVWKGSWATAVEWTGKGDMPKESLSNRSCRQIVHVSFGGEELRVKLSNEQSKEPVEIKSVYIADTDVPSNWGINAKTVKSWENVMTQDKINKSGAMIKRYKELELARTKADWAGNSTEVAKLDRELNQLVASANSDYQFKWQLKYGESAATQARFDSRLQKNVYPKSISKMNQILFVKLLKKK